MGEGRSGANAQRAEPVAFLEWLAAAARGEKYEYHRGVLTSDIAHARGDGDRELFHLAAAAYRASNDGLVTLIQHRYGPDDYGYIAVRSGKR